MNPETLTGYYTVSDVWMGRAWIFAESAEQAARHQYLQTLQLRGYDEDSDQGEVKPEQFRAWPSNSFPEDLSFEEAFNWIGERL